LESQSLHQGDASTGPGLGSAEACDAVDGDVVETPDEALEYKMIWLENYYNVDQILEHIEDCSKECTTCNHDEQVDCRLEMREAIHSLALTVKELVKMWVNATVTVSPEEQPATTSRDNHMLYG